MVDVWITEILESYVMSSFQIHAHLFVFVCCHPCICCLFVNHISNHLAFIRRNLKCTFAFNLFSKMNSPPQEESDPFDDSSNNSEDSPNISLLSAAEETEVGAITSDASLFAKIDTIDQTMRKLVFIVKQIREMGKSVNNRMLLIDLDTTGQKRLKCLSDIPDMNAKIQNAFNLELNSSGEGVIRWYKVKDYLL